MFGSIIGQSLLLAFQRLLQSSGGALLVILDTKEQQQLPLDGDRLGLL